MSQRHKRGGSKLAVEIKDFVHVLLNEWNKRITNDQESRYARRRATLLHSAYTKNITLVARILSIAFHSRAISHPLKKACCRPWYTWLRPAEASRGVGDLGAISTSRSGLEIAPRSLTPSEAALGRSHVYQRAEHAKGISLAPGIVPKGQSRRARRPAAHRHQTPQSRLWEAFGEVSRGSIGRTEWSHRPFHTHT